MKKILFLLSLITIIACSSPNTQDSRINSFSELKTLFKTPPIDYSTSPFWVWNNDMTEKEIDLQMADFKSIGIDELYIHPRPGLITEYLGEDWFRLFKYALDKAKKLDMKLWIYDENTYPSGFAGGHVPAQMPDSYKHGNGLRLIKQNKLEIDTALEYGYIFKKEGDKYINITSTLDTEIGKEGDYYLYEITQFKKSNWFGEQSYVDLIYKGVTEKFIEITMTGYEEIAKDDFGGRIKGVFTDEPNIASKPCDAISWTPDLPAKFEAKWGYKIEDNLISMFEEVGDWKKIRHNYYQVALQLFVDRWSKPWNKYCAKNNLKWTGHYWEHGWPHVEHGADNMAMYAWHTQPGIDMLFNSFNDTTYSGTQFGNIRSVKELASVANQYDYPRKLSETYGGGGWWETFETFKQLGDWEYVLGVNHMNQHLAFATLQGTRKNDYPPSFSYHEPWFKQYKVLADYYKRLSLALSSGKQINKILIIEPTTTAWMYAISEKDEGKGWRPKYMKETDQIGEKFQLFLLELERKQVEYDLGSENIIKDVGSVNGNSFVVNKASYDLVVLPPGIENIDKPTFDLLQKYISNGGKVIVLDNLTRIDGAKNEKINTFLNSPNITKDKSVLFKENDVKISWDNKGKLYHQTRIFDDGKLIFLVNSSLNESCNGTINITGNQLIKMDLFSGYLEELASKQKDDKLTYSFNIPPAGSILLFSSNNISNDIQKAKTISEFSTLVETKETKVKMTKPNSLHIDYLDIEFGDTIFKGVHFDVASEELYKGFGFEKGNPWFHSVQYKTNILDKKDQIKEGGFKATYYFNIKGNLTDYDLNSFQAVAETTGEWDLYINGNKVDPMANSWWIDRSFLEYKIGDYLIAGENKIELIAKRMTILSEIAPVYINGDFSLENAIPFFSITPANKLSLGSWKKQGYPFYYHSVKYSKTANLEKDKDYEVSLKKWLGTTVEIMVNGESAGQIFTKPYTLNISDLIIDGKNTIDVIVYGSFKNLFGPHHNERLDMSGPWSWKYCPKTQPKGEDYLFLDYGLMEDFEILSN